MHYARIDDGVVAEVVALPDGVSVADAFHPDIVATLVPCSDKVEQGWTYNGATFAAPAAPVESAADRTVRLVAYAADKRWRVETAGIAVAGITIATDERSRMMIMGARIKAGADPNFKAQWKTPAGFVEIDAAAIVTISDAVLAHVESCFAVEATVIDGIKSGAITSIAEVDAADWPTTDGAYDV